MSFYRTRSAPSAGIRRQHRHRVWQHRLNAAPRGRCKQGMFPLLLCCSLQSRCGLRTLGVRLSPCCSIRAHLWHVCSSFCGFSDAAFFQCTYF